MCKDPMCYLDSSREKDNARNGARWSGVGFLIVVTFLFIALTICFKDRNFDRNLAVLDNAVQESLKSSDRLELTLAIRKFKASKCFEQCSLEDYGIYALIDELVQFADGRVTTLNKGWFVGDGLGTQRVNAIRACVRSRAEVFSDDAWGTCIIITLFAGCVAMIFNPNCYR